MKRVMGLVSCMVVTSLSAGSAQVLQPWSEPAIKSISLDALRPAFEGGGTSTLTTVDQLSFRWPVGAMVLTAELPFVNAKVDGAPSGALLIGNPFLGASTAPTASFIGDFGVRIPIVSASTPERGFAQAVGVLADFMDLEAYGEDLLSIRATAGYRYRAPSHLGMRVALRPTLVKPVGSSSGADSELFLDYGVQGGYETARASFGITFTGRALLTEPGSIGERTVHDLALGGSMTFGQFRPGVLVRVPLESDIGDLLKYSVGLKLEVVF
jgi:hypothetical protein